MSVVFFLCCCSTAADMQTLLHILVTVVQRYTSQAFRSCDCEFGEAIGLSGQGREFEI